LWWRCLTAWLGRIAQLVEQLTLNQRVQGSSPCAPTILFKYLDQVIKVHPDTALSCHSDKAAAFVLWELNATHPE
jgi:hypothetical protein